MIENDFDKDTRRLKRYDEIERCCKHLRSLCKVMKMIGISSQYSCHRDSSRESSDASQHSAISRPLFICFDLGMRQRSPTYNMLYFQAILIHPSSFNVQARSILRQSEKSLEIAEGGRYDDLVRRYRPPGNFNSTLPNSYVNASIPICVGVTFNVCKLVESFYIESSLNSVPTSMEIEGTGKFTPDVAGIDLLRRSLGHPLHLASSVKVVVASTNGMDATSASERLFVASHLWAHGISAEYLTQSGVMISLLHPKSSEESTLSVSFGNDGILGNIC
jgi:histidyl-tRNA synthetase